MIVHTLSIGAKDKYFSLTHKGLVNALLVVSWLEVNFPGSFLLGASSSFVLLSLSGSQLVHCPYRKPSDFTGEGSI
jgi:hypothetical protein